jgi:hypothetical protein
MSKIHLEEGQWGALDHRTFITIVQRSEAKLGQACIPRVTPYRTAERSGA